MTSSCLAAVPPDVRKGSAFPIQGPLVFCEAMPHTPAAEAQPQKSKGRTTERHSLSAHQVAEPQGTELGIWILSGIALPSQRKHRASAVTPSPPNLGIDHAGPRANVSDTAPGILFRIA